MSRTPKRIEGVRVLTSTPLGDGRSRFVIQEAGPVHNLTLSFPAEGGVIASFILSEAETQKLIERNTKS
jgi:hypothetical protein